TASSVSADRSIPEISAPSAPATGWTSIDWPMWKVTLRFGCHDSPAAGRGPWVAGAQPGLSRRANPAILDDRDDPSCPVPGGGARGVAPARAARCAGRGPAVGILRRPAGHREEPPGQPARAPRPGGGPPRAPPPVGHGPAG